MDARIIPFFFTPLQYRRASPEYLKLLITMKNEYTMYNACWNIL